MYITTNYIDIEFVSNSHNLITTLVAEMFGGSDFWLETRVNIKISTHSWYPRTFEWFSWKWSKKIFFLKNKKQNGRLKKRSFFKIANSQYFFVKISWIGPWINWCGSTYMAVRLSYISSITGKKCIFCVFRLFLPLHGTASRPYRLSYINALRIKQSY